MPFDEALRAMLRLSTTNELIQGAGVVHREVTYNKEGDLYQIHLRRDEPSPQPFPGGGIGGYAEGAPRYFGGPPPPPAPVEEKVPVNYLRIEDALSYLSQESVSGVIYAALPHENALLVRGDPALVQNFKHLLQLADVPRRPLQVSVGISGPGFNGAPLAIRSSARSLVGDGVTIDEQAMIGGQPAHLKVTLRPQLQGDGNLQTASDWDVSVPVAGGPKGPVRLVKRLSTTTLLAPGRQVPVAEVDLAGWGGKGVLRLWIEGDWGDHLLQRSASAAGARPVRTAESHAGKVRADRPSH
jgi:hypothetical protein